LVALSVCLECAAKITWVKTVNDVAMPLDRDPNPGGNIRLLGPVAHKVPASKLPIEGEDAYTCHLDTCPKKRTLTPVTNVKPRCASCGLVMDPTLAGTGQTTHPCC